MIILACVRHALFILKEDEPPTGLAAASLRLCRGPVGAGRSQCGEPGSQSGSPRGERGNALGSLIRVLFYVCDSACCDQLSLHHTTPQDTGLYYDRYLREVIEVLETDPHFREKLQTANSEDIKVRVRLLSAYILVKSSSQ